MVSCSCTVQACVTHQACVGSHLGQEDLAELALRPGRALESVAPVHEGTLAHP